MADCLEAMADGRSTGSPRAIMVNPPYARIFLARLHGRARDTLLGESLLETFLVHALRLSSRTVRESIKADQNDQVTDILLDKGLAWKTELKVSDILVHPSNSGGQMLGVEDVWQKGMRLLQVGLKKELLVGSVCFEAAHEPTKKEQQMFLNQSLVEQSGGLLAPMTGKERFMSVGASHTCAFFRAAQANCNRPESCKGEIAIKAGEPLADILENGWSWLVISGMVEQMWPDLPRFYQMALNAHVASLKQMSEVEAAAQIALCISNGLTMKDAIMHLAAMSENGIQKMHVIYPGKRPLQRVWRCSRKSRDLDAWGCVVMKVEIVVMVVVMLGKVHKVLRLQANLHFKAHKVLQGPQSTAPATTSALQGPQSTSPATKFALQGPQSMHLPRILKTNHMLKSHDSLHLSRNQSASKTSKVLRLPRHLQPNAPMQHLDSPSVTTLFGETECLKTCLSFPCHARHDAGEGSLDQPSFTPVQFHVLLYN